MATEEQITQLQGLSDAIENVDEDKLLRPSLGEVALQEEFASKLTEIQHKMAFALAHVGEVYDSHVQGVIGPFEQIRAEMEQQADRSNEDYVANRPAFLSNIDLRLMGLKEHWPSFVAAAVESRGFLEDEGLKREYESTVLSIKEEAKSAIQQVQEEAKKTIEEARTLADQIESRARLTASGISVEEAQKQFHEAQTALDRRVYLWTGLAGVSILGFICVAIYFALIDLPEHWRWHVIYHGAIRVTILAAVGTVAAFCLKVLRAHLHMSEKNRHRQRVANSIGAFVDSAGGPEQRDMILSQLVESVTQFGNSGLIQRDDDNVYRSKTAADSILRTMFSRSAKE